MSPTATYTAGFEVVVAVNGQRTVIGSGDVDVPVTVSLSGAEAHVKVHTDQFAGSIADALEAFAATLRGEGFQ